ncbi:MAG: cytochrome c [Verrucomicrobia bacterium]|nr:cytochrome c [Verrucomicrobiota bacterium]
MPSFLHLLRSLPFLALPAGALAAEITLPPETARYVESPLPGYATAVAMCSTCHSADYARIQPPTMARAAWKANVTKMQKTFGAPIADDAIDPIVDYLVKTYGAERAPAPAKSERPAAVPAR